MAQAGLAAAFVAFALWVSGLGWRWLDAGVAVGFALGLGASLAAALAGRARESRRLAIAAAGVNAFGLLLAALVYTAG
jgi:hypothetical protein